MKHLIWFGMALLLSVMPTTPALAQYEVQPPNFQYEHDLRNTGSQLCLQPEQEANLNGLAIVQQPCNGSPYQHWYFLAKVYEAGGPPGTFWVINSGSGQCLDDRDGKTADRSPVQQWTCNFDSTTMQWKLASIEPTQYPNYPVHAEFINVRSGKCLDVRAGWLAPGAALQIYHCSSTVTAFNYAQDFTWWPWWLRSQSLTRGAVRAGARNRNK